MTSSTPCHTVRRKPLESPEVENTLGPKKPKPTGLVYDPRMTLHKHEWFSNEQESPARIQRAFKRCQEEGLVMRCTMVPARQISEEALTLIHGRKYIQRVKQSRNFALPDLYKLSGQFDGVFFNQATWTSACLAAGSLKHLTNLVVQGRLANGFALIRPPGHHAMHSEACGYCFFNNVAVTAASLLDPPPKLLREDEKGCPAGRETRSKSKIFTAVERVITKSDASNTPPCVQSSSVPHGPIAGGTSKLRSRIKLKRILIVDWDVHHGQGTQYTFYQDNRVLFISLHRYEQSNFWPNLREANFDFIGHGAGRGYNVNIPLDETGLTDSDYLAIFHQLIMPIAIEFNPELVLVSCGFDAAIGCPEGRMWLSPAVYGHFIHHLKTLAGGKLVVALEGGYYVDSLAEGSVHVLKALLGDPPAPLRLSCPPCKSTRRTIEACATALRAYWKSLWICGPPKMVPRPDLSQFPLMSWSLVRRVVWPEANPLLPDQIKQHVQRIMNEYLPIPLSSPSCQLALMLISSDAMCASLPKEKTAIGCSSAQVAQNMTTNVSWSERLIHQLAGRFHIHFFRADKGLYSTNSSFQRKRIAPVTTPDNFNKRQKLNTGEALDIMHHSKHTSSAYVIPPGVLPSPLTGSHFGRTTCGCTFATCGKSWSKTSLSMAPELKAALRTALFDLFQRKFSRVFVSGQQVDPYQVIEAVTDLSAPILEDYRTCVFRTRSGRRWMGRLEMVSTNNAENQTDTNQTTPLTRNSFVLREASPYSEYASTSACSESPVSNYSNVNQILTEATKPCRLLVVDLSGIKDPFGGKSNEKLFTSAGQSQCDLLWCSILRGSYAEQLASCPVLQRTAQPAHISARSNRRIRHVQWLRLPVVDSKLPTTSSSNRASKKDSSGANLLAVLLHILLPAAYEYAPELICVRLEKEWIDTNDRTDNALGHLLHLLNGVGSPVIVCYCRPHPPSSALLYGMLGCPLPGNTNENDCMVATSSMQSLIHRILQVNGSRWKNLKFSGSSITWQA